MKKEKTMSYGEVFEIDGKKYLLEVVHGRNLYTYVAERISEDEHIEIAEIEKFDETYEEQYDIIHKLPNELYMRTILMVILDDYGKYDAFVDYSKYVESMLEQHTPDEIINSSSDERIVYAGYYPLDIGQDRFVSQTIYAIKDIFTNKLKKLLLDGQIIRSINWDENEFVYFSSRHLMLLNEKGIAEDFAGLYVDDFYDLKTGAEKFERPKGRK